MAELDDQVQDGGTGTEAEVPAHVREADERMLRRHGFATEPQEEREETSAAPAAEPAPKPEERPAASQRRIQGEALKRREDRRFQAVLQEIAGLKALVEKVAPQPASKELTPEERLALREKDDEAFSKLVLKEALEEVLGKETIAHLQKMKEEAEAAAAREQQVVEARERIQTWLNDAQADDQHYFQQAPEESAGYYDRRKAWMIERAKRHIEIDGMDPDEAWHQATLAAVTLYSQAQQRGLNGAQYLDRNIRYNQAAVEGNGHREAAPAAAGAPASGAPPRVVAKEDDARARQERANEEARRRSEAARASGSALAQGGSPTEASPEAQARRAATGQGSARALLKALAHVSRGTGVAERELLRGMKDEGA